MTDDLEHLVIRRSDFGVLAQTLLDVAGDGGTQPAYRRGMLRAMSAFQNVLVEGAGPVDAARNTVMAYE